MNLKTWAWILGPTIVVFFLLWIFIFRNRGNTAPQNPGGGGRGRFRQGVEYHWNRLRAHPKFWTVVGWAGAIVAILIIILLIPDGNSTETATSQSAPATEQVKNAITEKMDAQRSNLRSFDTTMDIGTAETDPILIRASKDDIWTNPVSPGDYIAYIRYADGEVRTGRCGSMITDTLYSDRTRDALYSWKAVTKKATIHIKVVRH